ARVPDSPWPEVTQTGGAQSHGRSQEKNLAVASGDAPRPSGAADRGTRGVSQLRRIAPPAPRLQPLRPLRRPRGGGRGQGAEGRRPGLTPSVSIHVHSP